MIVILRELKQAKAPRNEFAAELNGLRSDEPPAAKKGNKPLTALEHIIEGFIKIAGIPGIGNIPIAAGKGQELMHPALRIAVQHPHEISDIGLIHADNHVGVFIIIPGDPGSPVGQRRDAGPAQSGQSSPVRAVPDFLGAGGPGINNKILLTAQLIYQVLKNKLRHGAAADIAVAHEKHPNFHQLIVPNCRILPISARFAGSQTDAGLPYVTLTQTAKIAKILPFVYTKSSQIVVKIRRLTTRILLIRWGDVICRMP